MSRKTVLAGSATFLLAACGGGGGSPSPGAAAATPSAPVALAIPAEIPASAFLQTSDVPGRARSGPDRLGAGDQPLPEFCGSDYQRAGEIGVRGTQSLAFAGKDAPDESTPKAVTYEDVLVFRGDGATAFLAGLRAAVASCPEGPDGTKNRVLGELGAGDESVVVEQAAPATAEDGTPLDDGSQHYLYWAVSRVGDSVAFVANTGWESGSAERGDTEYLGRKATARLAAWRH